MNENKLFQDGTYTVWSNQINELKPNDTIWLTTSTFEYDCITGCFINDIHQCAQVELEIINEDLSEYDPKRCRDGGAYGFASAKVKEIIEVGY